MPKKKREWSFVERMKLLRQAGLSPLPVRSRKLEELDPLAPLEERVQRVLDFLKKAATVNPGDMHCFIMYDITDNKIRNYIAKYLLREGCQRVQKSVYIASMKREKFLEIVETLREVNDLYENEDSIFLLPIGETNLAEMRMVGRNVDYSLAVNPPNTFII